MNELTLLLIKFAYLAVLWIFVLSAVSVIRSDMFGARVEPSSRVPRRSDKRAARQSTKPQAPKRIRGAPAKVVIIEGPNAGATVSLDLAPILIGRGADAAIRLDDDYVSTRHARIALSGETWFVEDLGSTNGTYIGAHRLTQPTTIQLGTQVRVGKTTLELRK